ncbi:hypothetical protein BKA83DRAFT_3048495 [Pisolithus microcarpus]|nr:hypothetical protein BKA83DRAFT_3048495 [Pisolithus microcarpus]
MLGHASLSRSLRTIFLDLLTACDHRVRSNLVLSGSKKAPVPPLATHACLPLSCHGRIHAITFLCHMCLWGSSTHITSVRPSLSIFSNFPILAHSSAVVDRRLSINFLVLPSGEKGSRNRYISGKKAVGAFFFGACCQIYIGGHTWIRPRCASCLTRPVEFHS